MTQGRRPTTICNGCGKEAEETVWWVHCVTQTTTNTGLTYDIVRRAEDFCPECWKVMVHAVLSKRTKPA